jgi:hypothetical protein
MTSEVWISYEELDRVGGIRNWLIKAGFAPERPYRATSVDNLLMWRLERATGRPPTADER